LREMLYSPLTVVIGRQAFKYGNSFIIDSASIGEGDSGIASIANDISEQGAADAIRAILDYDPLKIELLYSKIDENLAVLGTDPTNNDDIDLYGINTSYELGDKMKTAVEAYIFAKIDKSKGKAAGAYLKNDSVYVKGLRASTNLLEGLVLQGEYAWQTGRKINGTTPGDTQRRNAQAGQLLASFALPDAVLPGKIKEYKPVLGYELTYASGDNDAYETDAYGGWDPLYEGQAGGKIYDTLFAQSNCLVNTASLTFNPMEDLTTKLSFSKLMLADELEPSQTVTLLQPDGTTQSVTAVKDDEAGLGWEIDASAMYDYTEDVQIGLNLGWYNPGKDGIFENLTND
ncbi:MAG: hypothetical protein HQL27_09485, partial [Candidatus Omnitrophica bacterium]|nr:hypothetical protein [Candidatus Omnitrophota bacterium]